MVLKPKNKFLENFWKIGVLLYVLTIYNWVMNRIKFIDGGVELYEGDEKEIWITKNNMSIREARRHIRVHGKVYFPKNENIISVEQD